MAGRFTLEQDDRTLRERILTVAEKGRAILDQATSENRSPTDDEKQQIDDLLVTAAGLEKTLEDRARRKSGSAGAGTQGSGFGADYTEIAELFSDGNGGPQGRPARGKAWGTAVVKACSEGGVRFKGVTAAGSVLVAVPAAEPVALGQPVMSVRSLIPSERTAGVFAFMQQVGPRTNNAAPVPHGTLKPTTPMSLLRRQQNVSTIAHLTPPVARQDIADAPLLQEFISSELLYGLEAAYENQILNGDGVGANFQGLNSTSGILTVSPASGGPGPWILAIRRAITRLDLQGIAASGVVMNPTDYETLETSTDSTGTFLLGTTSPGQHLPLDRSARRVWGLPCVTSVAVAPGTAWVADFATSVRLYERQDAVIDWSESLYRPDLIAAGQGSTLFETNQLIYRAEMRAGLAVLRPSGVVKVTIA